MSLGESDTRPTWAGSSNAEPPPVIDGDRCVHALLATASCTGCGRACPEGAITFGSDEIILDSARCDGCGLCVPACPQQAISGAEKPAPIGKTDLFAACQRVAAHGAPGVMRCLHAIGVEDLMAAWLKGVRRMRLSRGACEKCACGSRPRLEDAVRDANAILASRDLECIRLSLLDPGDWRAERENARRREGVDGGRRRFLGFHLRKAVEDVVLGAAETETTQGLPALASLPATATALFPCVPVIDERRCTACDACIRVCPTGALALVEESGHPAYALLPSRCNGCAMCIDVCEDEAIGIDRMRTARAVTLPLRPCRCRACGASYHASPAEPETALCRICRKTQRHRQLYQVLESGTGN